MKRKSLILIIVTLIILFGLSLLYAYYYLDMTDFPYVFERIPFTRPSESGIKLPSPKLIGTLSVEEALSKRRSVRDFNVNAPLSLEEVSQLLWSAQGITEPFQGKRTAPSAGATYPLEIYLVVRKVEGLKEGVYQYYPPEHEIFLVKRGDFSKNLQNACWGQGWVGDGAINLVITASFERTTNRYGKRGEMYVHMEAGHVGQNIYLQAEALGLGTVAVGAFNEEMVTEALSLPSHHRPLYVFPVGKKL